MPGELLIVTGPAVTLEDVIHRLRYIIYDKIHCRMCYAKRLVAESESELIHHVRYSQIVRHPSVAEHSLDIPRLGYESCQYRHDIQPSCVIIQSVLDASPLTSSQNFALTVGRIELAQRLIAFLSARVGHLLHSLESHYFSPPCSFLISMLSTKAWTRVRIWPAAEAIL